MIKNKLKVYRAMHDLTQEQLADRIGVTRQTVIAIEGDKYLPSLKLAFKIARLFQRGPSKRCFPMKRPKMKINKKLLNSLLYIAVVGFSMLLLAFVVSATWIGQGVKENCQDAQRYYQGDCVQVLSAVLQDEHNSYRTRNSAIWSLGQLGDPRAWELLNSYYTGVIPPRESLDEGLSQYELKKAIRQVSGGLNISRWPWAGGPTTEVQYDRSILTDTVVIAQSSDAYYPLAEKIAENEGLEIVGSITEAMMAQPRYIILVAEPANLTQARLVNISRVFKRLDAYPALGIISGDSLESAEALWQRKDEVEYGLSTLGTDVEKGQLVTQPTLFDISPGATAHAIARQTKYDQGAATVRLHLLGAARLTQ